MSSTGLAPIDQLLDGNGYPPKSVGRWFVSIQKLKIFSSNEQAFTG